MWYEYIISAAIGIVTGVLSSWLVTTMFNKKTKKELFEDEKQLFERYINSLRTELSIHKNIDNINAIQRILEDEPILKTFAELSANDFQTKDEISDMFSSIKISCSNKNISNDDIDKWNSELLKYRFKVLQFKRKSLKKNKRKNKNG